MIFKTRLRAVALAATCIVALCGTAEASPKSLSQSDADNYAAAFAATERGDFIGAQMFAAQIADEALKGHLLRLQLLHPSAHRATYEELSAWLERYADLAGADRVYALAMKRRPQGAPPPPAPVIKTSGWGGASAAVRPTTAAPGASALKARRLFYDGRLTEALNQARAAGEDWIAGLAAYRLRSFDIAAEHFERVARGSQNSWTRAAGAFWAARAHGALGAPDKAAPLIEQAAREEDTFYGMIAARRHALATTGGQGSEQAATGQYVPAAFSGAGVELNRFVRSDARARRAVALAQIGLVNEAGLELRAGLTLAADDAERSAWSSLIMALGGQLAGDLGKGGVAPLFRLGGDYPTPLLDPQSGFTIDKALVYAIVRQESRFNPAAVSRAGAVGLMQLMPEAAARAAGDDKLRRDITPLFDPSFNLRVGQDYVSWLMEKGAEHDLLRTVAAYNGGPGTLKRTAEALGEDADSLLLIECLPAQETRDYVEKVVAAYWTYRRMFGSDTPTLDALARGARLVDIRLDRTAAN